MIFLVFYIFQTPIRLLKYVGDTMVSCCTGLIFIFKFQNDLQLQRLHQLPDQSYDGPPSVDTRRSFGSWPFPVGSRRSVFFVSKKLLSFRFFFYNHKFLSVWHTVLLASKKLTARYFIAIFWTFFKRLFPGNLLLQLAALLHRLIMLCRQGLWQRKEDSEKNHNSYRNINGGSKIILG